MSGSLGRIPIPAILSFALGGAALLMAQPARSGKPEPAPEQTQKLTASAIQLERIVPPEGLLIPEDTRISMYENVILQLIKTKKFQHVYRSGDRTAADAPDLVILHLIPEAFKPGSQKEREVITIAGATSIKVKVQLTSREGKVLLEKDVEGKVRFYGENLRATYDLAKKVAGVVKGSF
jgi:hypothetical protein